MRCVILILDEKKVRKGKPAGLPYVGSKRKVSKKIVEIIKQNFGTDKKIYDVFGGGGAITAECLINNLDIVYNEKRKEIVDIFLKVLKSDNEYLKSLLISRDEFLRIRAKEEKTVDDNLKLLVNSFGYIGDTYLYGRGHADVKYNLAVEILKNEGTWKNYRQSETYKQQLEQLQRLQQLEQLEQLQRLEQLEQLQRLEVYNKEYAFFSFVRLKRRRFAKR